MTSKLLWTLDCWICLMKLLFDILFPRQGCNPGWQCCCCWWWGWWWCCPTAGAASWRIYKDIAARSSAPSRPAVSENVARPNSNFEEGTWWLISEFRSTLFSDKRIFLWPISNFVLSQSSQEHPHQTSKPRAWWQPAGKVGSPAIATERKRRAYASRWQGQLGFLCEWRYQAMADKIHSKIKTIKLAGSAPASTLVI